MPRVTQTMSAGVVILVVAGLLLGAVVIISLIAFSGASSSLRGASYTASSPPPSASAAPGGEGGLLGGGTCECTCGLCTQPNQSKEECQLVTNYDYVFGRVNCGPPGVSCDGYRPNDSVFQSVPWANCVFTPS